MKRKILGLLNSLLQLFGIAIYKSGFDMSSSIRRIRDKHHIDINTIVDIGASDGKWSKLAMNIFPNAKIIAIEPLIERELKLEKLKKVKNNFDFAICALGQNDNQKATIMVTDDLDGSTISGINNFGNEREINLRTLDSLILQKKLKGPFLLKFDTHGYELPILQGAKETLRNTEIIIMEVYNYKITGESLLFNEMVDHLSNLGFRSYDLADPLLRPLDDSLWQMDLYFMRKNNEIFNNNSYRKPHV